MYHHILQISTSHTLVRTVNKFQPIANRLPDALKNARGRIAAAASDLPPAYLSLSLEFPSIVGGGTLGGAFVHVGMNILLGEKFLLTGYQVFFAFLGAFLTYFVLKYRERKRFKPDTVLTDDRTSTLQKIFQMAEAWDQQVRRVNRLMDQAELGIIAEDNISELIQKFHEKEGYVWKMITYAERLLKEGPLGEVVAGSTDAEWLTSFDPLFAEIDNHQEGMKQLSLHVAAKMEIERLS